MGYHETRRGSEGEKNLHLYVYYYSNKLVAGSTILHDPERVLRQPAGPIVMVLHDRRGRVENFR